MARAVMRGVIERFERDRSGSNATSSPATGGLAVGDPFEGQPVAKSPKTVEHHTTLLMTGCLGGSVEPVLEKA
jgi:hypothetical protein